MRLKSKWEMLVVGCAMATMLCACESEKVDNTKSSVESQSVVTEVSTVEASTESSVETESTESSSEVTEVGEEEQVENLIASIAKENDKEDYETLYSLCHSIDTVSEVEGEWHRTNVHSGMASSLTISEVDEDGFTLFAECYYYLHTGEMEERVSWITEDVAILQSENWDGNMEYVLFDWNDDELMVYATASSGELGFGMNVFIDGEYILGTPEYTNANALQETFTEEQLAFLEANLSEEDYENIVFITTEGGVSVTEEGDSVIIHGVMPTAAEYSYTVEMVNGEIISVTNGNGETIEF